MSILIRGMDMPELSESITIYPDGRVVRYDTYTGGTIRGNAVELPPHGRLIDADALIKEINERIDAAIKWGVNAIADRNAEIKLRAEQAVATFCEASLTAKKLPTIIEAEGQE